MDKQDTTNERPILTLNNRRKTAGCVMPVAVPEINQHIPIDQHSDSETAASDLAKWLSQQSPAWCKYLPLKLGIIQDIYALLGDNSLYSKRVIHKTLRWHTSRNQYLRNVLRQPLRYGLDGQPTGEVTDTQRQHAQNQLNKRHKKPGQ